MIKERDIETVIDKVLANKGWIDDPEEPDRNVYKRSAKTSEQNRDLERKEPDYILYETGSTRPLIVIEAKRPGKNIEKAMQQCEGYAKRIKAPICYVTDGVYTKTMYRTRGLPLFKNGDEIDEFIRESEALQYLHKNSNEINTLNKKIIKSRKELISIFDSANSLLRAEGLSMGLSRFSEFSNILFLKLISEIESIKEGNHTPPSSSQNIAGTTSRIKKAKICFITLTTQY